MNAGILQVMKDPAIMEQLSKLGAEPMLMSPAKFDQMIKTEMDASAILVKESKMSVN